MRNLVMRLALTVCALLCPALAQAQLSPFSDVVLTSRGSPAGGASVAVCGNPGLATTGATVTSNIAILTMTSNPVTAGFVANMSLTVSGFTGADTYLNGSFTSLSVTATTITFALTHANATATSNGSVFQTGTAAQACAPLVNIFSDSAGLVPITQPGFTADGLGNFAFYTAAANLNIQFYGPTLTVRVKPVGLSCNGVACTLTGLTVTGAYSTTGAGTHSGPETFTGSFSVNAPSNASNNFLLQNPGVFTNSANLFVSNSLNGLNIGTFYTNTFGAGKHQTDASSWGVACPVGTAAINCNAVAAYATTNANSSGRTVANTVAFFGVCGALVNSSACWGLNTLTFDAAGLTGHNMTGYELDINLLGSPSFMKGVIVTGLNQGGTVPASATAFEVSTPYVLPIGYICDRGSCTVGAVLEGLNSTNPTSSQPLVFRGYDGGGVLHHPSISGDANGNILLQPDTGSAYSINNSGGGIGLAGSSSGTATLIAPATGGVTSTLPSTAGTLTVTIASGTTTLTSGNIVNATCQTRVSSTATGALTTDSVEWAYATAPSVTTDALLTVSADLSSAGNVGFTRCNTTATNPIASTAIVINWRVTR